MSVFPLTIVAKEDTAARLLELIDVAEKNKFLATDFNQLRSAVLELHGRGFYLEDANGKKWYVTKGDGNVDVGAFQTGDKVEAWIDAVTKTEWVEGLIMASGFVGVADLGNSAKFFKTGGRLRVT